MKDLTRLKGTYRPNAVKMKILLLTVMIAPTLLAQGLVVIVVQKALDGRYGLLLHALTLPLLYGLFRLIKRDASAIQNSVVTIEADEIRLIKEGQSTQLKLDEIDSVLYVQSLLSSRNIEITLNMRNSEHCTLPLYCGFEPELLHILFERGIRIIRSQSRTQSGNVIRHQDKLPVP